MIFTFVTVHAIGDVMPSVIQQVLIQGKQLLLDYTDTSLKLPNSSLKDTDETDEKEREREGGGGEREREGGGERDRHTDRQTESKTKKTIYNHLLKKLLSVTTLITHSITR